MHERIGTTKETIPFLEIGNGQPEVALILGLHGDETTGHLIINELIQQLHVQKGTLKIILQANPSAAREHQRTNSIDKQDINRIFPGALHGTIIEQTAHTLLHLLENVNAVIDFHTFAMDTPIMGVLFDVPANKKLMQQFCPVQIWDLQFSRKEEREFRGSLGATLTKKGVPNIAIETNIPEKITKKELLRCVQGIKRVLHAQAMMPRTTIKNHIPLQLTRTKAITKQKINFSPKLKPLQKVTIGQILGDAIVIPTLERKIIRATKTGILMQISHRATIPAGSEIFAIGEVTPC